MGGGKRQGGYGYAFEYSYSVVDIMTPANMRPDNSTWHFKIPDVVYYCMDWICPGYNRVMGTQLRKNHGMLTAASAISDVLSVTNSGNTHAAVYDLTAGDIFVSFGHAGFPLNATANKACHLPYTYFNLQKLFSETLH